MPAFFSFLLNRFRSFKQRHKQATDIGSCQFRHYAGQIVLDTDTPYRTAVGVAIETDGLELQHEQTFELPQAASIVELQQDYGAAVGTSLFHSLQVYSLPPSTTSQLTPPIAEV